MQERCNPSLSLALLDETSLYLPLTWQEHHLRATHDGLRRRAAFLGSTCRLQGSTEMSEDPPGGTSVSLSLLLFLFLLLTVLPPPKGGGWGSAPHRMRSRQRTVAGPDAYFHSRTRRKENALWSPQSLILSARSPLHPGLKATSLLPPA